MNSIAKLLALTTLAAVCLLGGSLIIAHYHIECLQKDLLACYVKVNDAECSIQTLNQCVLKLGEVMATYKYKAVFNEFTTNRTSLLTNLVVPLNK